MKKHQNINYQEIAIDRGYSACKVLALTDVKNAPMKKLKFSSAAVQVQTDERMGHFNVVQVKSKFFVVGEDALQHLLPSDAQFLNDEMSSTDEFEASILHALDSLSVGEVQTLKLSIADALFGSYKAVMEQKFQGVIDTGNRTCSIKKVKIIPQGLASALSVKTMRPKNGASWISIDVGHRTVLMLVWNGSRPNVKRSHTFLLGGHLLIDTLAQRSELNGVQRQKLAASLTHQAAKSIRRTKFNGVDVIISEETVRECGWGNNVTRALVSRAEGFEDVTHIFVTGASADLLAPSIREHYPKIDVYVPPDHQFAVARGMLCL
jgi:Actin like proteins N terminal domain